MLPASPLRFVAAASARQAPFLVSTLNTANSTRTASSSSAARRLSLHRGHFSTASSSSSPSSTASMAPAAGSPIVIVAGVGPGTGAAIARRFAKKYPVVLLARKPANFEALAEEITQSGGTALGISTDVTSGDSVKSAFSQIQKEFGGANNDLKVAAAVFNLSGGFARKPFLELTMEEFDAGFTMNAHAGFIFAQAALPLLQKSVSDSPAAELQGRSEFPPTLIFTGATASMKGSAMFASFAHGKFALRAMAQSLGREFGPKGVHVAHAVIDGVIDIPRTKDWDMGKGPDAKIDPDAIAEGYFYLHSQPRTSWTFEIDLRPFVEKW